MNKFQSTYRVECTKGPDIFRREAGSVGSRSWCNIELFPKAFRFQLNEDEKRTDHKL